MQRRQFMCAAAKSVVIPATVGVPFSYGAETVTNGSRGSFAVDGNRVRFTTSAIRKRSRAWVVADTHLFRDDGRGEPYRQYSQRMAAAYHQTEHFQTGATTNPEASFATVLAQAQLAQVDRLALVGDIFSFPSEAAIDWVGEQLTTASVPYLYVAGNHDWHYEGLPGSLEELRATWIEKRLKPLYQGNHPLMASYQVGDVRFLAIDNSHYQILPEQLEFFRSHVTSGQPLVLVLHIPLYAPGRPVGFGCGHPSWGAKSDRNHELERRPRWPDSGHSQVTLDFHRDVFAAPNLLGIFAGHIHRSSLDVIQGIPQFVTDDNASGAFLDVEFLPATDA